MTSKAKPRLVFSILAGTGRAGLDVPAIRARLRHRLLTTDGPLRLSEDERLFLLAELAAAELEPEIITQWDRFRAAAADAWRKRSIYPLRDALELPRSKGGRPRLDRGALLEAAESGASEAELRQRFGLSKRQLRKHLSDALEARNESC